MRTKIDRAKEIYNNQGIKSLANEVINYLDYKTPDVPTKQEAIFNYYYNKRWETKNSTGIPVMDLDWDNLIVLDACRYDEFFRQNPFDIEVETRVTLGSSTSQYLKYNFLGQTHHDTVYVTANPKPFQLENGDYGKDRIFHSIHGLFDDWNEEYYTVLPETVNQGALTTQNKFPNKKLIIHYMQPHVPYIGDRAKKFQNEHGISIGGLDTEKRSYIKEDNSLNIQKIDLNDISKRRVRFKYGIDIHEIWEMYRESLSVTLSEVEKLVSELDGKTAITSDHGEMLGERPLPLAGRMFGHPSGVRTDELCKVPWVVIDSNTRKPISSDPPIKQEDYEQEVINKRLTALGYK